jgi:hypothetical protein
VKNGSIVLLVRARELRITRLGEPLQNVELSYWAGYAADHGCASTAGTPKPHRPDAFAPWTHETVINP